jgi:flagellar basal-body rod modification protein FlgD
MTTKAWSEAAQTSSMQDNQARSVDASEMKKHYGDLELGDVLNKAADPNWVDPKNTRKGVGNSELNKEAFLTLMLEQLKAQDPFNPIKSHEMSAQLAQFTSLEQLYNINDGIESLTKTQGPAVNYQALALIGKSIESDSSKILRTSGDKRHDIAFYLKGDAQNVEVTILDETASPIRTLTEANLKRGENKIFWNGTNELGEEVPVGQYSVDIKAVGGDQRKVGVETSVDGLITGVNFGPKGPMLMVGNRSIPMSDVKKIKDPSMMKGPDKGDKIVNPALKKPLESKDNELKGAQEVQRGNVTGLPMARPLKNALDGKVGS